MAEKQQCSQHIQANDQSQRQLEELMLQSRMKDIGFKLLVLSGKGGVGKSTVAANLAVALALADKDIGLLDVDVHGPSIPKLMGLEGKPVGSDGQAMLPVDVDTNLKVMSIGFLVPNKADAVIWRGPMKYNVIKQFLSDVAWGQLDFLVVDSPPGTGDEPLAVAQLVGSPAGAVIVTTPQELAISDVRRCVGFCRTLSLPVIGIIENMSGFVCPHCGQKTDLFGSSGGRNLALEMNVPFLGTIPIDPQIVSSGDTGVPFANNLAEGASAKAFAQTVRSIIEAPEIQSNAPQPVHSYKENNLMKIAIPLAAGQLSMHFGHCEEFALVEVDQQSKQILNTTMVQPPAHAPGVLPAWLHEQGANVIIAGGMGSRAQQLFAQNDITVVVGAASGTAQELASAYLEGTLQAGENICDH